MEDRRIHVMIDGEQQDLSLDKWNKNGGATSFAKEFPNAEVRMRDNAGQDYSVPISQFSSAAQKGLHMFTYSTTPAKTINDNKIAAEKTMSSLNNQIYANAPRQFVATAFNKSVQVPGAIARRQTEPIRVNPNKPITTQRPNETLYNIQQDADREFDTSIAPKIDKLYSGQIQRGHAAAEQFDATHIAPPEAGIGMGLAKSKAISDATDAGDIVTNIRDYISSKQKSGKGTGIDPRTDRIMSRTIDYLAKKQMPKSTIEYILRNMYDNSLIGSVTNLGLGKSATQQQVEQRGNELYKPSKATQIASGVGSLLLDSPLFGAGGKLASGITKLGVKGAQRIIADKLIEASGKTLAKDVAMQQAARVMASNTPKAVFGRIAQGMSDTALNLGGYDATSDVVAQTNAINSGQQDKLNVGQTAKRGLWGAATGAASGILGGTVGHLSRNLSGAGKALSDLGGYVGDSSVFAGMSALQKYANGEPIDLTEDAIDSFATLGAMKIGHIGSAVRNWSKASAEERKQMQDALNFTPEDKESLSKYGIDGNDLIGTIGKLSHQTTETHAVPGRILAEGGRYIVREAGEAKKIEKDFDTIMKAPDIPISTKNKVLYMVKGRQVVTPMTSYNISTNGDKARITTYDWANRPILVKDFKTDKDAKQYASRNDYDNNILRNTASVLENINDKNIDSRYKNIIVNNIASAVNGGNYSNLSAAEKKVVDSYNSQLGEAMKATVDEIKRSSGIDVESLLNTPRELLTPQQVSAVDKYNEDLNSYKKNNDITNDIKEALNPGYKFDDTKPHSPVERTRDYRIKDIRQAIDEARLGNDKYLDNMSSSIRNQVKEDTGIDVNKALESKTRTKEEDDAIGTYIEALKNNIGADTKEPDMETQKYMIADNFEKATENIKDIDPNSTKPEDEQKIKDYDDAKQQFGNYVEYVNDKAKKAADEAENWAKELSNKKMNGLIVTATTPLSENPIYIVDGQIVHKEDGSIDYDKSDPEIIYVDPNDGKRKMASLQNADGNFITDVNYDNYDTYVKSVRQQAEDEVRAKEQQDFDNRDQMSEGLPKNEVSPTEEIEQNVSEQPNTQEQIRPVPLDENGKPVYHKAPIESTLKDMRDKGADDDTISEFAQMRVDALTKEQSKLDKQKPAPSDDFSVFQQNKAELAAQKQDVSDQLDYWNNVYNSLQQTEQPEGQQTGQPSQPIEQQPVVEQQPDIPINTVQQPIETSNHIASEQNIKEKSPSTPTLSEVKKDINTKNGEDIYIVQLVKRVERDEYDKYNKLAKDNDGYYSKYKKGFLFKTEDDANNFKKTDSNVGIIEENSLSLNNDNNLRKTFSTTVENEMLSSLESGNKPFRSILDLRKIAKSVGMQIDDEGRDDILLQELVENGLIRAAKKVIDKYGRDSKASFDNICKLYDMQPTIAARSSNRIKMQQYSTPLPMSWIADLFAMHSKPEGEVFEPTAGNGMMVFSIPSNQVHVNEIDDTRLSNLREQGFAKVTEEDASIPFKDSKTYDAIVSNPPFGKSEPKDYDGKMIGGLDPQIALNSLSKMKDNGRASIIIGGNMEYADNGSIKSMKPFFTYLYDHYNVKGVIDMDGKLYSKQGTSFPTRMILIDGRRSVEDRAQTSVYPPIQSRAISKVDSFDSLYETVNDLLNSKEKTNGTEILRSKQGELGVVNNNPSGTIVGNGHNEQPAKNDATGRTINGDNANRQTTASRGTNVLPRERRENTGNGKTESETQRNTVPGDRGNNGHSIQRMGTERVPENRVGLVSKEKRTLNEEKLKYIPHNSAYSLNSVAPAAMVEAMDKVLTQIESKYGNIDDFVKNELYYDTVEEAHQALAAEQLDSVAMAIYQMKQGKALIIGDQTGVGKGRQMAALIRWAVKQGEKPIFITQKADLFSDIYRDLVDIGSGDLSPFIFNSDGEMVDNNGITVHKPLSQSQQAKVFEEGVLPSDCDFAILTYSQVNTGDLQSQEELQEAAKKNGTRVKKSKSAKDNKPTPKATFLREIAKDNYLLFDESHTAAGSSNTGAYLQSIIRSAKGVTFASATFAKRPDTMPIYALRTSISNAKMEANQMINIIEKGGVTLQEIMSRELTNAGQMVRRERDMSDVKTDWKTIDDPEIVRKSRENYDKTITAFNSIIKFQEDYVKPKIAELDSIIAIMAQNASVKKGTNKMGVENVPFASKTYNYTKQLMLALKVNAIAEEVEKEINAGRHPVIALESTMELSIKDYSVGDIIQEPTFSASLLKGLDTVMQYTVTDENGKKRHERYSPRDLGEEGERAYNELKKLIKESTSDIFISPLDAIIEKLKEKGYKVGELTGRNTYVERNDDNHIVVKRRTDKDKKRMQRDFNNGTLDVLILNKSASTGISLHASEKFSDKRQRSMIIAQPLSDINDYMQMIGRIDRTGQVHRGYYINLGLPVPAENRFLMMLSTKLKSLNANTTTSQDSESNEVEAPDLLNKYGSQVVVEYLRDNPEIYDKLGSPLKKSGMGAGRIEISELDEYKPQEDDARRITGYVALLSTKEQEEFYNDVVRRYNELIKYLNDTGSNDLKISVMPLRTQTLDKRVSSAGIDPNSDNPFSQNSYVEKVEMDVLRKPMKSDEIRKTIEQLNNGLDGKERVKQIISIVNSESEAKKATENTRYESALAKSEEDIKKQTDKIKAQTKRTEEEKAEAIQKFKEEQEEKVVTKHEDNLSRINANSYALKNRLNTFDVGKSYLIPDNFDSMVFDFSAPAIFCGYKCKETKITPSTTLAVFATLDGRRRVEIKLSQLNAIETIERMTNDNWDSIRNTTLDNWDKEIPSETRKQGYIMTGNILQAIADTQDEYGSYAGQLVSYTNINGEVHDGILMPDKWNPTMLKSSGAPLISKLSEIKDYQKIISNDGKVEINGNRWAGTVTLTVPRTKKEGAKYYENDKILEATINHNFFPYHGKLRADVSIDKVDELVQELTKLGVKVKEELNENGDNKKNIRFRTSEQLDSQYPTWLSGQVNDNGKHSTQISGTVKTYDKIGKWVEDTIGKDATILDASSGLGVGTESLRKQGFNVDDVEPYPSKDRIKPTYAKYDDIDKKYDVIISNAVLNVIPDDWRADVLKNMADKLNVGGKLIINVRDAKEIENQKQKIELDSPSEILVTDSKGRIRAYQKGFTEQELIKFAQDTLGKGWNVEKANNANSGIGGARAIVITRETGDKLKYRPIDKIEEEKNNISNARNKRIVAAAENLSNSLHTVLNIVHSNEIDGKKSKAKAWYDVKEDKVYLVPENNIDEADAEQSILHEVVAHKGLRKMFGEDFDNAMWDIYKSIPEEERKKIAKEASDRYDNDFVEATEEYLASMAEKGVDKPSLWKRIVSRIRELLRKVGIKLKMSDNDIKYLLWKSRRGMEADVAKEFEVKENIFGNVEHAPLEPLFRIDPKDLNGKDMQQQVELAKTVAELNEQEVGDYLERMKHQVLFEAWIDKTNPIRVLQDTIMKHYKENIPDDCDAHLAYNAMTSRAHNEKSMFQKQIYEPLIESVKKIGKYDDVMNYLIAKHGMERNALMRSKEIEALKESFEKAEKDIDSDSFKKAAEKIRYKDFSGLTGLQRELKYKETDKWEDDLSKVVLSDDYIQSFIDSFEENKDETDLAEMWALINIATDFSLETQKKYGCISQEKLDEISSMYEFYIPLRDWSDPRAEDFFDYLNTEKYEGLNMPLKKAFGRKSKAGDPIANIASMADSAIVTGNKNRVRQHLFRLVFNYPTNLAHISPVWYTEDEVSGDIQEIAFEQPEGVDYDSAFKEFKEHMDALEHSGQIYKAFPRLKVGKPIKKWQSKQHATRVKINGDDYIVYMDSSPRAAQAINGENVISSVEGLTWMKNIQNFMARNFTSRMLNFVFRNFFRDYAGALTYNYVYKYGSMLDFVKSTPQAARTLAEYLLTGSMSDGKYGTYLKEFLENGGETGYGNSMSYNDFVKDIKKDINTAKHPNRIQMFRWMARGLDVLNRGAEDTTRFTAYISSREGGKSVMQSIKAAKEISVNFNRAGSGDKGNAVARIWYMFLNAGIQALYNTVRAFKNNPVRASLAFGTWAGIGFLNGVMQYYMTGDNDYFDIPDWVRQNNLAIKVGQTTMVSLPLALEIRPFFAIGDILAQATFGKYHGKNAATDIATKFMESAPYNFFEGKNERDDSSIELLANTAAPSALKPFFDVFMTNRDYTGKPISKQNEFNRYVPEYKKGYKSTSDIAIRLSKLINDISGGDNARKGYLDNRFNNPAVLEYLFNNYGGGVMKQIFSSAKSAVNAFGDGKEVDVRDIPVASAVIYNFDSSKNNTNINQMYYNYINDMEESKSQDREYKKDIVSGSEPLSIGRYIGKKSDLNNERKIAVISFYKSVIDKLNDERKMVPEGGDEAKNMDNKIYGLKKAMVEQLEKY